MCQWIDINLQLNSLRLNIFSIRKKEWDTCDDDDGISLSFLLQMFRANIAVET